MTVFVIRDGKIVERAPVTVDSPAFPCPMISRMTPFESPVTGREISSWRERERDMTAVGAVDPRDLPRAPFEKRKRDNERSRRQAQRDGTASA